MLTDYTNHALYFLYGLGALSFTDIDMENWGHDGNLIYRSIALYFPQENMSLAVQQNDNRSKNQINFYRVFDALLEAYIKFDRMELKNGLYVFPNPANGLYVFPNPANGLLYIEIPRNLKVAYPVSCILTNRAGGKVTSFDLQERKAVIHLEGMPPGFYFLQVGGLSEKVIIAR